MTNEHDECAIYVLTALRVRRPRRLRLFDKRKIRDACETYVTNRKRNVDHDAAKYFVRGELKERYGAWWVVLLDLLIPIIWQLLKKWIENRGT